MIPCHQPSGFSIPRWLQSASCSSPRAIVTPSAAQTTCGWSPERSRELAPPALLVDERLADVEEHGLQRHAPGDCCEQRLDEREIGGVVHLQRAVGSPSTTRHAPAGALDERGAVGGAAEIAVERAPQDVREKRLRRLRRARARPDRPSRATTPPAHALHRVLERERGDRAVEALARAARARVRPRRRPRAAARRRGRARRGRRPAPRRAPRAPNRRASRRP